MVAKISKGTSLYGVLLYNQDKVDKREATVIHSRGIIHDEHLCYTLNNCLRSFDLQLIANNRTKKPAVHISLNPDPRDRVDDGKAVMIALDYLEKMGYGEQPFMLYRHNDIERVHYHIVTVSVNDKGAKINDKYEKRRSMAACREIEKKYDLHVPTRLELRNESRVKPVDSAKGNISNQIRNTVGALIRDYKVSGFSEYKTLLEQFGCTYTHVDGRKEGKTIHGIVYFAINESKMRNSRPLKSSLFGKEYGYEHLKKKFLRDKKHMTQKDLDFTKRILVQCMHQCKTRSKEEYVALLKRRGVSLVLHTNKENRVFGLTFIDHNIRSVMNGSTLGKEFSANNLSNFFDNPHFLIPFPNENKGYEHSPAKEKKERNGGDEEETPFQSAFSLFSLPSGGNPDDPDDRDWWNKKKNKKKIKPKF